MIATDHVGDAFDGGIGEDGAKEVEFTGADGWEAGGNHRDGAVVFDEAELAVRGVFDGGEVALRIEDGGDLTDAGGKIAVQVAARSLDAGGEATLEEPGDQGRILLIDGEEEIRGEFGVGGGEERFGRGREGIGESRAPWPGLLLAMADEPNGSHGGEVLADAADGNPERGREIFSAGLPVALELEEYLAAAGGKGRESDPAIVLRW